MAGIIEELQRGALDPNMAVDALLRRVKLAAVKLRLPSLEGWVEQELNGYQSAGDLPPYRELLGQLRAWNPYNGWIPVHFQDQKTSDFLSTARVAQACASLVDLINRPGTDAHGVHYPLPPFMVNQINSLAHYDAPRYIVVLSRGHVVGILDRVRNLVLDWAIRMEQQGIVGEGISFSDQERQKAQHAMTSITIGSIGNFAGNLGEGNRSTAISANQTSNEADVFSRLSDALANSISDAESRAKMIDLVAQMQRQSSTPDRFAVAYGEFIAAAANHMQIVAPFLPALLPFLAGG